MGTTFEVRLGLAVPGAVDLATRALDVVDALEAQLTVYRDDSEISRINAAAHLGPMAVERRLFGLLRLASELSLATGGAYDVAAGALSAAWGFTRGPRRVPSPAELFEARFRTGQGHVRLDLEAGTIAFDRPGVVLNLGGIGKGYAIDRAVALVRDYWWPTGALIHGGRSSLYALGSPPGQFGGPLGGGCPKSAGAGIAPGHPPAAQQGDGNLRRRLPALRLERPDIRPHHRPPPPASRPPMRRRR